MGTESNNINSINQNNRGELTSNLHGRDELISNIDNN